MKAYKIFEKKLPLRFKGETKFSDLGMEEVMEILSRIEKGGAIIGSPGEDFIKFDTDHDEDFFFVSVFLKKENVDGEKIAKILDDFYKTKMIENKERNKRNVIVFKENKPKEKSDFQNSFDTLMGSDNLDFKAEKKSIMKKIDDLIDDWIEKNKGVLEELSARLRYLKAEDA